MPVSFVAFNTPKSDVMQMKVPSLGENSAPFTAIVKANFVPKPKTGAPPPQHEPPKQYIVLLVNPVTLNRFLSEKEKLALDLPKTTKPGEPVPFKALSTYFVKVFGGRALIPGRAYEFLGAYYTTYQETETSPVRVSLRASAIKAVDFDTPSMLMALPYETIRVKIDVKSSFFAVPIEQDPDARSALVAEQGDCVIVGHLQLPEKITTENLIRSKGDITKNQKVTNELALSAGKTTTAYLDPFVSVFQSTNGLEEGEQINLQFFCESSTFHPFMVSVPQWETFGPTLLLAAKGVFFGEIDQDKSERMPEIEGHNEDEENRSSRSMLILDAEAMIRRVGVPIDWNGLLRFFDDVTALDSTMWPEFKDKTSKATTVLNIGHVRGDLSGLEPFVESGEVQLLVLSNWNVDADDFAALKALPPADRVSAIQGGKEIMNLGYGRDKPIHMVYAIGPDITRHVAAIQVKKRARA
jgi:hypothetical protein